MKAWHKKIHDIYIHNDENTYPDDVKASNKLSPLTNFFINVFLETLGKNNIIVTIPDTILKPIPIVSYIFASLKEKSVLVFTQKGGTKVNHNPIEFHRRNYHLLNYGKRFNRGDYLFKDVPLGTISKNKVNVNAHIPLSMNKKKYKDLQEKNFLESDKPKILLSYDEKNSKITKLIDILIEKENNKTLEIKSEIKLGLVIFENVDRFLGSEFELSAFLKWLKSLSDLNINYIFHFSNPESKFIKILKDKTNSLVIPWSHILLNNPEIKKDSLSYFAKCNGHPVHKKILGKFNIDSKRIYCRNTKFEVINPILDPGNIDYHYMVANQLLKEINAQSLINGILFSTILSVFYKIPDILINPSKFKYKYRGDEGYLHYTLPQLLKIFKKRINDEDKSSQRAIKYLLSEIFMVYSKLKERKRYNENVSYNIIGKNYLIKNIIEKDNNWLNINKNKIIVTYSPGERNILKEEINNLNLETEFKIEDIDFINKSMFDKSNTTLILPGPLRIKYFSELLKPYENIYFLAYSGRNLNIIRQQINLVLNYSSEREKILMDYLDEIYDLLDEPKPSLLIEYHKQQEDQSGIKIHLNENKDDLSLINSIINSNLDFKYVKEYEDNLVSVEKAHIEYITNYENKKRESEPCLNVLLKKIGEESLIEKALPLHKNYCFLRKPNGKIHEDTPENLKPGYLVVIIDNDERKSLLELIIEIYNLEEKIDKDRIKSWKWKLNRFVQMHDLKPEDLYKLYLDNGGKRKQITVTNWLKGSVIGPKSPIDLLIIGKILKDDEITENYKLIEQEIRTVRAIHQDIGRKIQKIIKETLNGELNLSELNFIERKLYEKIKDGLYEVHEINNQTVKIDANITITA